MTGEAETLDLDALRTWVAGRLPGFDASLSAQKFAMGQSNPTYRIEAGKHTYVLRRKPLGSLLKSAHAVDREYRVQAALAATSVPVAQVHLLCEDPQVLGATFYIMAHVDGRNFTDPRLTELSSAARYSTVLEMNRVLCALHEVDVDAVGLQDFGPPGDYFARQIARWSAQYRATETEAIADMNALIDLLSRHLPPDDGQRRLVHGDFRIDNMIFAPEGGTCLALLDWELSTLGHPYADLAAVIMQWQLPPGPEGRGLLGVDRAAAGLVEDAAFVDDYCQRRKIPRIENFQFYLAFSFFRMAAILQGVLKRALDGTASNPEKAIKLGAYVPTFASQGLRALDRTDL